ncbi:sulfatase-like hydrolase/transferase [Aporhodopirellula aestuarii]|uniref:Sulfatase-like hydrolase/transferase n=1 Tax=Aporhodopirellula aestuarii TaxID=2950107 RepID=A0ABT0TX30_9BACT|nr:sulfatase-like hydrolase/transferase [Aporhodopirellula aestuarii]MCM2369163.1 sulfatase-like hydrolase/transferase [Aporhodopirellula aestuarii]
MTHTLCRSMMLVAVLCSGVHSHAEDEAHELPNILWVITDDQRPDSLACFNRATRGTSESELGYVSSPNVDMLAKTGVMFTHAYCNSPGCAPSRGSMITGRYPFRNGIYGFEQTHNAVSTFKPVVPEVMRDQGYQAALFGKSGYYIFDWGPGLTWNGLGFWDFEVDAKNDLQRNGLTDWSKEKRRAKISGKSTVVGTEERFYRADGSYESYLIDGEVSEQDVAKKKAIEEELDLLYSTSAGHIIGGRNSQPSDKTLDGCTVAEFVHYLEHAGQAYETGYGLQTDGASLEQPVFLNLGFHFPHTPVMPPQEFRDAFAGKQYRVPEFDLKDLKRLPPQLKTLHTKNRFDDLQPAEKQQAIRDYYAFCAFGDSMVGQAVDAFKTSSKKQEREYLIVYVCGDHSWHLGEQGIESKFGPYDHSNHNAVIVVSSDTEAFPPGTVCEDFVEFVDFAPTFYAAAGLDVTRPEFAHLDGQPLQDTVAGNATKRDYVLGEMNHVYGPRAYIRSKDFAFSMRTRFKNGKAGAGYSVNEKIRWALDAAPKEVEMALFDLRTDPKERVNVADDERYIGLADFFRRKLGNIVLGDRRLEVNWKKENEFAVSEFAIGSDDKRLEIPAGLVPTLDMKIEFGKVRRKSVFGSDTMSHWGGSLVRGDDGLYHMFYSRWPKDLGWAWVTDSEIAHAVSASPFGPFEFQNIALPRRDKDYWDGWCTHNPTVYRFGDKYYLYYMGNTGDGEIVGHPGKQLLNWQHRNNQRIGVAVADSPNGPWTRSDQPLIDVSPEQTALDSLMTSNPSICQRPDGGYVIVYKAVGQEHPLPSGGPVVHCVATSDSPTGPFVKQEQPVFVFEGERFPAEDPYIWFQDGKYRAIVKRIKHEGGRRLFSLVHYDSLDGLDWKPGKHHEISQREVEWEDGEVQQFDHLERPQVYVENGKPVALLCAADTIDENNVRHSFNIQIPLVITFD